MQATLLQTKEEVAGIHVFQRLTLIQYATLLMAWRNSLKLTIQSAFVKCNSEGASLADARVLQKTGKNGIVLQSGSALEEEQGVLLHGTPCQVQVKQVDGKVLQFLRVEELLYDGRRL